MALVAYDNSDSSDFEEEENHGNVTVDTLIKIPDDHPTPKDTITEDATTPNVPRLFNLLPQPSTKKPTVVEEDDEFLHKKEKAPDILKSKARITVPSLRDFKDVDSPSTVPKPKVPNGKKSGLLSILPQPRNGLTTTTSKSLMPHVLKQMTNANTKMKSPLPAKKSKVDKKLVNDYSDESDNEDDDVQNDFFSFHKSVEVSIVPEPLDTDQGLTNEFSKSNKPEKSKLESYFKSDTSSNHIELESKPMEGHEGYASSEAGSSYNSGNVEAESTENNEIVIDEEAIRKLSGTRGKRKMEEIQIVDVNQREVLADAREWLIKGLMDDTTKRVSASKKRGNEPTSQQKRKHQITYLAHQAKANEAELQNQWANSRMSRRQTQNKYGF